MDGSSIVAIFFLGKKERVKYGSIVWHTAVGNIGHFACRCSEARNQPLSRKLCNSSIHEPWPLTIPTKRSPDLPGQQISYSELLLITISAASHCLKHMIHGSRISNALKQMTPQTALGQVSRKTGRYLQQAGMPGKKRLPPWRTDRVFYHCLEILSRGNRLSIKPCFTLRCRKIW
jgi:hypothetical protein